MRRLKAGGLFFTDEKNDFRGVVRHQLLVGAMALEVGELCGLPQDELNEVVSQGLTHDEDKRRQVRDRSRTEELTHELQKGSGLARATSTHFGDFDKWGIKEYILRFCDSSVTTQILPWRERVAKLYETKADENELGKGIYGMGMWDKLTQAMEVVEQELYTRIIERHAELEDRFPSQEDLHQIVIERIFEKIINYSSRSYPKLKSGSD